MKTNKKLLSLIALSLLLAKPYNVFAADADSFRTDEYKAMGENVLDLVNAAGAYAQGYTGKGVTVGVTDAGIVNFSHTEFSGKTGSNVVFDGLESTEVPLTWAELMHPTHVAGIAAADKNGFGMHGVAYDADVASSSVMGHYYGGGGFESSSSFYDNYLTNPDIKIINNSWGNSTYLSDVQNEEDFNEIRDFIQSYNSKIEAEKAVNNDKLLVLCAGNAGHLTATINNHFDVVTGDKVFNDNIITVTAAKSNSFTKNQNGGFNVQSDAIAIFSDLAMYNEDTTLSAPGFNINSAYADFAESGIYYKALSGTSMAAPMVTGVGALVQQAFPYLSGKQIGDVLLSTANSDITVQDSYFITTQYDTDDDGTNHAYLNVYYFDSKENNNTNVNDDIIEYYKENFESGAWIKAVNIYNEIVPIGYYNEKLLRDLLERKVGFVVNTYYNVPLDVVFGQGIVDAGKAVNGLGAINVRRLDKSDISSAYTVQGSSEKQALYTVNTQGYNSVWSNDISEIRAGYIAENPLTGESSVGENTDKSGYDENSNDFNEKFAGLTDLHDRWVFYTTNSFDESGENWMTKYYMDQYNQHVKDSELAGLHAGLYKTGEGILALTGKNTYKGASIAAGGTLQIDGSVAGDAYSEGAGTIAGSGIIKGNLYNYGVVEAGSWGAVTDKDGIITLEVGGDFNGNGVISVNTDGTNYAQIAVTGDADVSGMSLKAGAFAAPGVTGTILTVGKNDDNSILKTLAITDTENSITGAESLNTDFSGMLNGKVTNTGTKLELTTSISNNAGIDGARFNAFNSLYNNLTKAEQQEMQRLYALNSGSLNNAVNELSQSESMHLELARDAIQNHDVRQAVSRQQHLDRDEGLWAITGKNWGETDGGITRHSYKLTLGKDFYNTDNTYAGALFAYSDNSIGGNNADGEYKNYSLGIYSGSKNSPGTVTGYVSYGVQDNELTRHLGSAFSHSGMGSKLESDYDSSVIGVGAKYAYDLHYGKDGWHVSPYAALDYAHYKQDSFTERGSVYGVRSGGFSDNYLTGELGFDFNREEDNGKYGFSLAYKRILDGDTLDADFAFAKGGNGFGVQSIDGSKNHIVATAYISTKLSDKWEIGGTLLHDWSSTDRDLSAVVNLNYYF
jgi:subtilase-type serine protease